MVFESNFCRFLHQRNLTGINKLFNKFLVSTKKSETTKKIKPGIKIGVRI